jgi:serine protease AprX
MCPSCAIGGEYIKATGTSFAAPMVTGAVADLLSQSPNLTPNQLKAILVATSQPLPAPNSAVGSVNIQAALGNQSAAPANQGLIPSTLLDGNGNLTGWSSTSFAPAAGSLIASWSRSSWSCASCTGPTNTGVSPTRSSWSRSSWSRSSWSVGILGN